MKYTYSDEEDEVYSDATISRRSTRNTGTHTPAEGLAPTVTLSGRQVKARQGGAYGESMLSGSHTPAINAAGFDGTSEELEQNENAAGRPRRAAVTNASGLGSKGRAHIEGYNSVDEMNDSDEDDASEQDYGDDEEEDHVSLESDNDDDNFSEDDDDMEDGLDEKKSLVVKLPVKTPTPERNTMVKLNLSPGKEPANATESNSTVTGGWNKADPIVPTQSGTNVYAATASAELDTNENAKPSSSLQGLNQMAPVSLEAAANPIPPKSPSNAVPPAPLSPLAFRGSPEKPHDYPPPSIDVGFGGS